MFVIVNPNMAIDKIYLVKDFRLDQVFRPEKVFPYGGGKGVNVARVIKTLGEEPLVLGFVGGSAGKFIENNLKKEGIPTKFVHIRQESRTCVLIIDPVKQTTTIINENGPAVTKNEISHIIAKFEVLVKKAELIILSGSLPLGVPTDFFARLIKIAKKFAKRVILDTSGEALKKGIEARPFMIKLNVLELQDAINPSPFSSPLEGEGRVRGQELSLASLRKKIRELNHSGIEIVAVTSGEKGMLVGYQGKIYPHTKTPATNGLVWGKTFGVGVYRAIPPRVNGISAVGSGDAVTAGFAVAINKGISIKEALCLAVASGTANTLVLGSGRCFRKDILRLKQKVKIARYNYAS